MTNKIQKIPGSDHPITIVHAPRRVIIRHHGKVIADSRLALTLTEATYHPVHYIPRGDADMATLMHSDHTTYCPYKGDCSYFSLPDAANAVWTYEQPYAAVTQIKDHLAFYPDKVEIEVLAG
ncbi:MAG TPA: DUF427 domain-containing protein [Rhizomicrobium sp.]|jgi:uncharacterized protein (DUF427 family)